MIIGNGFFLVGNKLPTGTTGVNPKQGATDGGGGTGNQMDITSLKLTRVGNFNVDEDGFLVDSQGYVVYGFSYEDGTTFPLPDDATVNQNNLVPIKVPEVENTGNNGVTAEDGEVPKVEID